LFFAIVALPFIAVAQTPSSAAWIQAAGYQTEEVFPLKVGKYGYPYVNVLVNGQKVEMVFDTANMSGLSISLQIAQHLNLPQIDTSTSLDADGKILGTARVFRAEEVSAFGQIWRNQLIYELESKDLDGLFGPRFLRGKRFTLDYRNRTLAISKSPLAAAVPESIPIIRLSMLYPPRGRIRHDIWRIPA